MKTLDLSVEVPAPFKGRDGTWVTDFNAPSSAKAQKQRLTLMFDNMFRNAARETVFYSLKTNEMGTYSVTCRP